MLPSPSSNKLADDAAAAADDDDDAARALLLDLCIPNDFTEDVSRARAMREYTIEQQHLCSGAIGYCLRYFESIAILAGRENFIEEASQILQSSVGV